MYVLGISCYYHDSSAALLKDGAIIAAAEEERFNRIRTYKDFQQDFFRFPYNSAKNVLRFKQFSWEGIDFITSHFTIKQMDAIWRGTGLGPLPEEKYIKINKALIIYPLKHHSYFELKQNYFETFLSHQD